MVRPAFISYRRPTVCALVIPASAALCSPLKYPAKNTGPECHGMSRYGEDEGSWPTCAEATPYDATTLTAMSPLTTYRRTVISPLADPFPSSLSVAQYPADSKSLAPRRA